MNITYFDNERAAEREAIQAEPREVAGTVQLGEQQHRWSWWNGQQLRRHFSLDTETTLIDGYPVPDLVLVSVSDGIQNHVMLPRQLPEFLLQHLPYDHHIVCHNVAFDFWVMDRYLANTAAAEARNWLWSAVDQQRLHDTMLLAGLVSLAQSDDDRLPSLADATRDYCGYELEKDVYRLRYQETIGQDWTRLDPGFFRYAVADAMATYQLYCRLTAVAKQITDRAGTSRQYGFLTEAIQVKAAICLDAIHRTGLHIDLDRAGQLRQEIDEAIQNAIGSLKDQAGPELFHRYKRTGEPKLNKANGLPKMNTTILTEQLREAAATLNMDPPRTATGKTTTSLNGYWKPYRTLHPLIEAYCDYSELTKLRTFFDNLNEPVIHPRYRIFVRSGRVSCSSPNIQQLPRGSNVREVVTAGPGNLLLIIDYSAVELKTLAAVCYSRYGFSRLGDVMKAGIDPHSYTAAMFAGMELEEFQQLPDAKQLRQRAKAINFGFPGGLGAATLVSYAKQSYGVDITQTEAAEFRTRLTEEVYPELTLYLSEDSATVLAGTLQADVLQVRQFWPQPYHYGMLKKVTEGTPYKADGKPYAEQTVQRTWQQLEQVNRNPQLTAAITARDTSDSSPLRQLMFAPVTTPTGRIRGNVSFTAARNTPFQGLAADGAKLAMWELLKAGYQVVAFVHDEFVIELSKLDDCTAQAQRIERICCQAMQQLVGDIPVTAEYALAERWYKQAEAFYDEAGQLQVWQPEQTRGG